MHACVRFSSYVYGVTVWGSVIFSQSWPIYYVCDYSVYVSDKYTPG